MMEVRKAADEIRKRNRKLKVKERRIRKAE